MRDEAAPPPQDDEALSPEDIEQRRRFQFGRRLAALRAELDVSQEGLGDQLGVSRQTVSKIERGEGDPSPALARKLEGMFGQSLMQLRAADYRPEWATMRPVYPRTFAGDPLDTADAQRYAVDWQYPPVGLERELGPRCFAVRVRGDGMAGYRPTPILHGATCWVRPVGEAGYGAGSIVAAQVWRDGECSTLVKLIKRDEDGAERLYSVLEDGTRHVVTCDRFEVLGRVLHVDWHVDL